MSSTTRKATSGRALTLKASASFITLMSASALVSDANAQTVILDGDNVTVTSQANGETITAANTVTSTLDGAPVVVFANDDVTLQNEGTLATINGSQTVQVSDGTTGGIINNVGVLNGDSRVVQIDGNSATLNNTGTILGTGNQRNGTVYTNRTATDFTLNNSGSIDAGAGNLGAGFSAEGVAEGTLINVDNSGTIQGRGQAGAGAANAGDGIRFERTRVAGMLDTTTSANFSGDIVNSGTINSESTQGTAAGIRFVNGVSFSGTITNEVGGTISGAQNGLYFGNATPAGGGDFTGAIVNNAGTISSDSRAFNIDGLGLTVNNAGDILGTGAQRNGTLYADGTATDFTINNSGTIDAVVSGSGFAAEIGADGNTFTFDNSGTIAGRGQGDAATGAAGDGFRIGNVGNAGLATVAITNSGTISSDSLVGTTAGLRIVNGISAAGTITNSGTITGAQNGLYLGNATPDGATDFSDLIITNTVDGTISSGSRAVNIDGTGATLINEGNILGTAAQRNGTVYSDGTATDFTVNNSGTIDAVVEGSGFAAEIGPDGNAFTFDNSGTIQGRGTVENADGFRVGNPGNIGLATVAITNSGTIASESTTGTTAGLRFVNGIRFAGTIDNSGTISGAQNGVYFGNAVMGEGADHSNGVFNNLEGGTISSDSRTFNIDGLGLTVNNAGSILGTGNQRNGTVYADSTAQDFTLNNLATGVIDAGEGLEGAGFSVELSSDGNAFDINNDGTIQGRGQAGAGAATAGDGIRFERTRVGGMLDGSTTGLFTGNITNTGTIASESTQGTTGGIRFVNGVSFSGTIDNSGTISGAQNGLYFGNATPAGGGDFTGAVVNNLEGGVISSDSRALNIDGLGLTVNNSGTIIGTGNQRNGTVYSDGTAQNFTVNNSGTIDAGEGLDGSGFAAEIDTAGNTFTFDNSGTIQGRGQGVFSDGFRVGNGGNIGVATVAITNSGTISSESTGSGAVSGLRFVNGISFAGTIDNSGTISGAQNGVYFGNAVAGEGADHSNGVFNNLEGGTISSDSRSFNIDGFGLTVNNAGSILGTGNQRNGTVYSDATADDYTLNNLATGVIDAGLGNSGSGVSLQSGDVDGDTVTFTVTNAGTIAGRGDALPSGAAAGLRVFAGSTNVTVNGDITNTGTITSETAPAILIEGVNYTGTITNSGNLSGSAAFDASAALGAINFVNDGGALNGNFIGSSFTDTLTLQGASTLAGSILGGVETTLDADSTTTVSGIQSVEGDLTANGTLNLLLGADRLDVTGNSVLGSGSVINVATATDVTSIALNTPTFLLTETGTFTDNGVTVNVDDTDFLIDFEVVLGSVAVVATAADLAAVSANANVSAFGGALTSAFAAGALDANVANALNSTTGVAGFESTALALLPTLNEGVTREVFETHGQSDVYLQRRLASDADRGVWVQAFGRTADRGTDNTSAIGYDADAFGVSIGADTKVGEALTVGAAFNYANIDIDSDGVSGEQTELDSFEIAVYAGYDAGAAFVNGQIGYIFGDGESIRQGTTGVITGDFDVTGFTAQTTAGYAIENGALTFTPSAGLRFASLSQDQFTETGGLNLDVDADSTQYLDLRIGAELAADLGSFKPFARIGYAYDVIGDERSFDVSFAGATGPFTLETSDPAQSRFEVGTGFNLVAGSGFTIGIEYNGEFASDYQAHGGFLRARVAF